MSKSRVTLATFALVAAALMPTTGVHAAGDTADTVRDIASEAADLVEQEQALLAMVGPDSTLSAADLAQARADLQSIDFQGVQALDQLRRLDIELTDPIQVVLDRLSPTPTPGAAGLDFPPPPPVVYEAAIADLNRISEDPDAVTPAVGGDRGAALPLLIVAALALLTLGAFALGSSMRKRPLTDELTAMAWSDGLTGLANRRRLDHDVMNGAGRSGPTAVIMVDVDHFKSINDNFGHQKGDDILRAIGRMLANQIRFDDVVYRYGGEEFCILLPNTTTDEALYVADRVVRAARQIRLPDGQHVTVSVGVATSTKGDVGGAVASADKALFEAKGLGRDQAVTAGQHHFVDA